MTSWLVLPFPERAPFPVTLKKLPVTVLGVGGVAVQSELVIVLVTVFLLCWAKNRREGKPGVVFLVV